MDRTPGVRSTDTRCAVNDDDGREPRGNDVGNDGRRRRGDDDEDVVNDDDGRGPRGNDVGNDGRRRRGDDDDDVVNDDDGRKPCGHDVGNDDVGDDAAMTTATRTTTATPASMTSLNDAVTLTPNLNRITPVCNSVFVFRN
ncbi:MAG: hypothetical protein FD157_4152 [Rhodocyclaceae bacterium]|nr:MAG: hypothetical protein FD157_4152 [Rhodocyclaceae bacterium]